MRISIRLNSSMKTFVNPPLLILSVCLLTLLPQKTNANNIWVVERWLQTNADTNSLKVDFVQSKALKTVRNPMVQSGVMWIDYPSNQFRWQLGDPAKTIVVSKGKNHLAVLRTPLKRVEYREVGKSSGAPGLSSLTRGFPKTMAEFNHRYKVLNIAKVGNSWEVVTQPLGRDGEGVSRFRFVIDQQRFLLKGLVIDLKDGSTVTTTFQRVNRNAAINAAVFKPDMTGYTKTKFRQG